MEAILGISAVKLGEGKPHFNFPLLAIHSSKLTGKIATNLKKQKSF